MKRSKIIAGIIAMSLFLTGCNFSESEYSAPDLQLERYDVAKLHTLIDGMSNSWNMSNQEEALLKDTESVLTELDIASEIATKAEIQYYADWNNQKKKDFYDKATEDYYVAYEMAAWAFTNGAAKSMYQDIFKDYADWEYKDYYMAYSLNKVIGLAKSQNHSSEKKIDNYFDTAYDNSTDTEDPEELSDLNAECAQIYLDVLEGYDLSNCLYDSYNRDYKAEEISAIYDTVMKDIYPLYAAYRESIEGNEKYKDLDANKIYLTGNLFTKLSEYAPRISDRVGESARKLCDEQLYVIANGKKSYDGSFTVSFPQSQKAMIYLCQSGSYLDFSAAVHEFGHFNSDWRDTTHMYLQSLNSDIAEVQSQGMQMLYTQFFDEIYDDAATLMEEVAFYDILDSIISGFAIGEFEYRVMKDYDKMSPMKVVDIYYEIADACDLDRDLYEITHLYQQPGYYISYGVSALPALEIYTLLQETPEKAAALYEQISEISSVSSEFGFHEALTKCGFTDFFDPEQLDTLIQKVPNRAE